MITVMTAGDAEDAWKGGNKIVIKMVIIISFFDFNCSSDLRCNKCVDILSKSCVDMLIMMTSGDAQDAT